MKVEFCYVDEQGADEGESLRQTVNRNYRCRCGMLVLAQQACGSLLPANNDEPRQSGLANNPRCCVGAITAVGPERHQRNRILKSSGFRPFGG